MPADHVDHRCMRGAAIGGSVAGDEFANAKFDAVWRKEIEAPAD